MKRDGRLLDHRTLEAIRLMAVERVRDGERPSSVVASYGFNRTAIYRWLSAAAKPGVGLRALHARPATGRPRSLTPHQEQQVFRWINGHDPRQYGLDFGLWARSVAAELIERKFAIRLGVTAVGELLAKLGLTPQKPLSLVKMNAHASGLIKFTVSGTTFLTRLPKRRLDRYAICFSPPQTSCASPARGLDAILSSAHCMTLVFKGATVTQHRPDDPC